MESATTQPTTHKMTGRTKAGLWLVISPTALIIVAFLLFAITNFIFNPTMQLPADGEALAPTPLVITIFNVFTFLVGVVGFVAWFPALIIGIVLLATAKK